MKRGVTTGMSAEHRGEQPHDNSEELHRQQTARIHDVTHDTNISALYGEYYQYNSYEHQIQEMASCGAFTVEAALQPGTYEKTIIDNYLNTTSHENIATLDSAYAADGFETHATAKADVDKAMIKLPLLEHAVIRLCFLEDRTLADVAQILDMDELTIALTLEKGIGHLRLILGVEYPDN